VTPALTRAPSGTRRRSKGIGRRLVSSVFGCWLAVSSVLAGCGSPILANPPAARPEAPAAASPVATPADPQPIVLPRDDGPHDRLTEWWYYTGHLRDATGRRFGFEFVVFRAERGDFPVTWASHLALTDEATNRFAYAQRSEIGQQVDRSPRVEGLAGSPAGFVLEIERESGDARPDGTVAGTPWRMSGGSGRSRLAAALGRREALAAGLDFGLDIELDETEPLLHDRDGWIDFGPGGSTYYYSRPRMPARGSLTLDGRTLAVSGEAWFDHQWGDFISVGGGWDWFAINLADGTDLALSLVRDPTGSTAFAYATLRRPDGTVLNLPAEAFSVRATGRWASAKTGTVYPAGWRIVLPAERLSIDLTPTVADQELDARPTSGVVYWEGSQRVTALRGGKPIAGEGYVELTGYAPAGPPVPSPTAPSPADSAP
jgi:predicted secreted hydrolase